MTEYVASRFYEAIRPTLFDRSISQKQFALLDALFVAVMATESLTHEQRAYVLATAHHETDRFKAMTEYASGDAYEGRASLGNIAAGDGPRYKGRGYCMLTGRQNYRTAGQALRIDLLASPEDAAYPRYAADIIILGMQNGWFTGHKLADYISNGKADYVAARAIINGKDDARLIAGYARAYAAAIQIAAASTAIDTDETAPATSSRPTGLDYVTVRSVGGMTGKAVTLIGTIITAAVSLALGSSYAPVELRDPETAAAISGALTTVATVILNAIQRRLAT